VKSFRTVLAVSLVAFSVAVPAMAQSLTLPPYMTADQNMRSSKLIGMAVYNMQNEKIGTLEDIMLPVNGGEVTAVLSVGGFLGIGEKMIKVPLSHVHFMAGKPMMEGDKAALTAMPKYSYRNGVSN